jgi:hypothetical protein
MQQQSSAVPAGLILQSLGSHANTLALIGQSFFGTAETKPCPSYGDHP